MLGASYGGQSQLNADMIDQLKEADKSVMVKPHEKRLEKVFTQQEDHAKLSEQLESFRQSVQAFSSAGTYLKRSVNTSSDAITVTAQDGTQPQQMNLRVDQLARNGVQQMGQAYESMETMIYAGNEPQTLTITQGEKSYEIPVTGGMTLGELRDRINDAAGGEITASILNTGGENPFQLVVRSEQTGAQSDFAMAYTGADSAFEFETIQAAQDAQFVYNGVTINRSTNRVDDLIAGVTLELNRADGVEMRATVEQSLGDLGEEMNAFVESYNETVKLLDKLTRFEIDSGERGSFQGDSRINQIRTQITGLVLDQNEEGQSMVDYGFDLNDQGVLSFDPTRFNQKLAEDPEGLERFLRGSVDVTPSEMVGSSIAATQGPEGTFEEVTIGAGAVKINGISLPEITFPAGNSAKENATIALSAINSITGQTGVEARLSINGDRVILSDDSGATFTISGNMSDQLGLKNGSFAGAQEDFEGVFSRLDSYMGTLVGFGEDRTLNLIDAQLRSEEESITNNIQRVLDRLNAKYSTMAQQFAAYNSMISRYEAAFSGMQMHIDALSGKKE
jgi:flagellar hook-associated protein 2